MKTVILNRIDAGYWHQSNQPIKPIYYMPSYPLKRVLGQFIDFADDQETGTTITSEATVFAQRELVQIGDLTVKVSFGIAIATAIPWIGFTGYGQKIQNGIYPVLLYYKQQKKLILAYGVSATHAPIEVWPNIGQLLSIKDFFRHEGIKLSNIEKKYNTSFVYKVYNVGRSLNISQIQSDLDALLSLYQSIFIGREIFGQEEEEEVLYNVLKAKPESYTIEMAHTELFLSKEKLEVMRRTLEYKKNIILQGPPGTGKTFIARRLAYLSIGYKDTEKTEIVQFHQSYSYEDFIQGYRPNDSGGFALKNGVFYEFCKQAQQDPKHKYFFIIDEINRGNLAKIFGELMMLIEHDKRHKEFALPLTYARNNSDRFYIPDNVHIIGTMNTADRSLAMVDYALRRRFAFINIEPEFGDTFIQYLIAREATEPLVRRIAQGMKELNNSIVNDRNLGAGFAIGHSYFCGYSPVYDEDWYERIVENEIEHLLGEYWFDDTQRVAQHVQSLLVP